MARFGPVFVLLAQVFCLGLVCGVEWDNVPEEYIYACAGSSVKFLWNFRLTDNEAVLSVNWIHDGALMSAMVATMVRDHFMATDAFSGRVRRVEQSNGGLMVEDVNADDSGNYTLELQVARGPVFESLKSNVKLQVSDSLMLKGGQLQASQDPVAWWDQSSLQWFIRLTCGPFTFMGEPAVDVSWTTPDGKTLPSTGYESGHFYLTLATPVQGGEYTCTIPPASLPGLCYSKKRGGHDSQGALSAHVTVDETKARLSTMEANQKTVRQDGAELEVTLSDLEQTHEQDMENATYCHDLTGSLQDQLNQMQSEQQSLLDRVDLLYNATIQAVLSGPCRQGGHKVLDESWRSSELGKTGPLQCDSKLDAGWYRFLLNGQTAVMPTECVPENHCNTHASEWLDLRGRALPAVGQETAGRTCASWSSRCCNWEAPVVVHNCGGFFIYKLTPRSNCHLAHCVELQKF